MLSRTCSGTRGPFTSTRIRAGPADICSVSCDMRTPRLLAIRNSQSAGTQCAIRNAQYVVATYVALPRAARALSGPGHHRVVLNLRQYLDEALRAVDTNPVARLDLQRC